MLPNNAYYVSLDGSRRVTQRTRAHIKPIAIFPLHAGDVYSGRPLPGATSDAPVVARPRVLPVPVTAGPPVGPETPPLEPAHAPELPLKIERDVDDAPARPSSSSPILRRRSRPSSATVSQPAPRTQVSPRFAPPVDDIWPKRRRGRPRKHPAPQPVAETALDVDAESAADAAYRPPPQLRPAAPAEDPAWQPRITLRRIDDNVVGPETRSDEAADAYRHSADQPEVARPRAVTRSGRVSRPPPLVRTGGG